MDCRACGATLREGARFCNKCGADQTETSAGSSGRARRPARIPRAEDGAGPSASSRSQTLPVATDVLDAAARAAQEQQTAQMDASTTLDAGAADSSELAEPEMSDADAPEDEGGIAAAGEHMPASPDAAGSPVATSTDTHSRAGEAPEVATARAEEAPAETPPSTVEPASETSQPAPTAPAAEAADAAPEGSRAEDTAETREPAPGSATDWEDADTVEYNVIIQRGQSLDAAPATPLPADDMPALDELARPQGDAMPWPLPESIIVGGRYRVEEPLTTVPDAPGAENVYRVRDLQGYERCWSCGSEHDADATPDRFCQECGADMLSRDFLLYERRQESESESERADTTGDGEEGVTALRTFTQGARVYRVVARTAEPPLFPRGVRVVAAMATDTGASRTGEENEDSTGIFTLSTGHDSRIEPVTLCVVADGLGGHASGQEASRLAVRILAAHFLRAVALPYMSAPTGDDEEKVGFEAGLVPALKEGVEAANASICARNAATGADMGSTCVAALVYRDTAYFINAGDSRGYVLEDAGLRRITTDHSLVEQLIASGLIPPEERYTHPQRNQIFRSLGDEPNVPLDTFTQKLRPGMRLLLCSDGLWEMVRDDEMARILRETASPQQACDLLIHAANEHGGEDNISAILVDICA